MVLGLPDRYEIHGTDDSRVLVCKEAPGIAVHVDASYSFSEAEARKLGERVILLDGVGRFAPLVDPSRHLYNLDHHEDCVRAFTLATCEQALVVVLKGLELERGDWTIYANQPDLDCLLAIWVLLNHRRVRTLDTAARDVIVPLIRLEGAIDANGSQLVEYAGLPETALRAAQGRLEKLFQRQTETLGVARDPDLLEFTLEMLAEIDELAYRPEDFSEFSSVEIVYGHVPVGSDRVALVCRDSAGIYEVEKRLKQLWGDRLAVIVLEREPQHYTIRRCALTSIDLDRAYAALNLLDPLVRGREEGELWGGSDDIGGSPRPSGSGLSPQDVLQVLERAYQPRRSLSQTFAIASVIGLGCVGVLWASQVFQRVAEGRVADAAAVTVACTALFLLVTGRLMARSQTGGRSWVLGWRAPARSAWLALIPTGVVAALLGAAWLPAPEQLTLRGLSVSLAAGMGLGLAVEAWFRGVIHGLWLLDALTPADERGWISGATLGSSLLYALVGLALSGLILPQSIVADWAGGHPRLLAGLGMGAFGVVLGVLRERTQSLWPGVAAQALATITAAWLVTLYR